MPVLPSSPPGSDAAAPLVTAQSGVTLAGGAPFSARDLRLALKHAPTLVAADGGANRLLQLNTRPAAVIGDMDSISDAARSFVPSGRTFHIGEQETTDFDKALRSIRAPFLLAVGFAGARLDHGLAAMSSLLRHPAQRCLLLGPRDIAFAAPPRPIRLRLAPGDDLSLFPFAPVTGRSEGLEWPIDGLLLSPEGRIGTSNRVSAPEVQLEFDRPGMMVILPRRRLSAAIRAVTAT